MNMRNARFAEIIHDAVTLGQIGKADIVWHDLRHSYAIHLLSRGVDLHLSFYVPRYFHHPMILKYPHLYSLHQYRRPQHKR